MSIFPTVIPTSAKILRADSDIPQRSESEAARGISNPSRPVWLKSWDFTEIQLLPGLWKCGFDVIYLGHIFFFLLFESNSFFFYMIHDK